MPIYEYICEVCKTPFDFFHVRKDEVVECPKCDSKKVEKQVAKSGSFILKGRGWAKDRYGK